MPLYIEYRLRNKNVHLHRNEKQTGLIAARVAGAEHSSGDVIVFLDSHCEATPGWYQPLAQHIKDNPTAIAIPSIDSIDHTTLEFLACIYILGLLGGDFGLVIKPSIIGSSGV